MVYSLGGEGVVCGGMGVGASVGGQGVGCDLGVGLRDSSARQVPSRQSEDILARGARRATCGGDVDGGPILMEPVGGGVTCSEVPGRHGRTCTSMIACMGV